MPHKKYPATSSAKRRMFYLGEGSRKTSKCIVEENQYKQYEYYEYRTELYQSTGKEQVITIINTQAHVLGKGIRCFPHSGQNMSHSISQSVLFCPEDTAYQAEESVLNRLPLKCSRQLLLTFPTPQPQVSKKCCVCSWSDAHSWVMEQGHILDFHQLKESN